LQYHLLHPTLYLALYFSFIISNIEKSAKKDIQ
jgi:hypothetical protein